MCGRYKLAVPKERLPSLFDAGPLHTDYQPRYNIAPTTAAPVVRIADTGRVIEMMRWGLIPHWSKEPTTKCATFNARAEDAADKPTYRGPMRYRRCLVPCDGFYEWKKIGEKAKQPYLIQMADEEPFAMAGLGDCWQDELQSFTVLTTAPNALMATIHNRMPVILDREHWPRWLDPDITDPAELTHLLRPFSAELMMAVQVSSYVNNARNEGPACAELVV
jgi:putative SOS response-associated peptidase YedK